LLHVLKQFSGFLLFIAALRTLKMCIL